MKAGSKEQKMFNSLVTNAIDFLNHSIAVLERIPSTTVADSQLLLRGAWSEGV
jgi:hypothetical protein